MRWRSLKNQVTLLVMGIIVLVTMIIISVFYLQARPILLMNTETEAKRDIATAEAIIELKYPGSWHTRGGILYKGQAEFNNNYVLVDHIKELTGASCSIYLNNICVSTTEIDEDCYIRAVDKPIPKEVRSKVLEAGQNYLGQTEEEGRVSQAKRNCRTGFGRILNDLPKNTPRSVLIGHLNILKNR